jgi:hypothetical protein
MAPKHFSIEKALKTRKNYILLYVFKFTGQKILGGAAGQGFNPLGGKY